MDLPYISTRNDRFSARDPPRIRKEIIRLVFTDSDSMVLQLIFLGRESLDLLPVQLGKSQWLSSLRAWGHHQLPNLVL